MERLRRRADFLKAAGGRKVSTPAFVLQSVRRADGDVVRVGFTVSRKVGTAVERNRVRRRLREVVELGQNLGIFRLRPVWLCSPEMVSRLFALSPGMFDVVVFDEASQLPIESSLAAMFRAKRGASINAERIIRSRIAARSAARRPTSAAASTARFTY